MKYFKLDPKHESFDLYNGTLTQDIWQTKYAQPNEDHQNQTFDRVVDNIYKDDRNDEAREMAREAMYYGLWMPGGRILSGAGTSGQVTLMNCYVSRTIEDSMEGIMDALKEASVTLSQYGGIGMNFGTIRPKGARINRTGLEAPGVITWMKLWNSMSSSIMQAGHRRGAMMGVIPDWHPDLPDFIKAKQTAGELTNFNVSVLVSDEFMQAVKNDDSWTLHFPVPPANCKDDASTARFKTSKGKDTYWYQAMSARKLWEDITRSTYEFSEPGVIFIDKINNQNNLKYCEEIMCTNPCGEQPLPPYGTCNLGAVNLARMISEPFTSRAKLQYGLLRDTVRVGTRFLDNVIDQTHYPLKQQAVEEEQKRRLGLGVSGLADALAQLGIPYNSHRALTTTEMIMKEIANQCYYTSSELAKERGVFPLYEPSRFNKTFQSKLLPSVQESIAKWGLRNGVLMTIAPTGTTSILFGNISSGIEPVFQHHTKRKVWQNNVDTKEYISFGFGARFYQHCIGAWPIDGTHPSYMVTADQVEIDYHVRMQAVCQNWVDASISKTINCPENISYDDFLQVYQKAYDLDCKGCTTYRPSAVRGAVLEAVEAPGHTDLMVEPEAIDEYLDKNPPEWSTPKRPDVLMGCTYKVTWPSSEANMYITINEHDGKPWEVFIKSKDLRLVEWTTVISMMISRQLRQGVDPITIAKDFMEIQGAHDGQWKDKKFYSSIIMYIGHILEEHFKRYQKIGPRQASPSGEETKVTHGAVKGRVTSEIATFYSIDNVPNDRVPIYDASMACPHCLQLMHKEEGCNKCSCCGYSKCG